MSNFDRRALLAALQEDAARLGISVPELIQRITSGGHVIGAGQAREMIDPPTYLDSGEGRMPQIRNVQVGETDDFEDFAERHAQALEDAGGDDLARDVLLRDGDRAVVAGNTTRTNPITATGARLGSQILIPSNTPINKAVQVARWDGNDPESTAVSVHLYSVATLPPVGSPLGNKIRPFAVVQWGCAGYLLTAEIDIGLGCELTVGGSTVMVAVGADDAGDGVNGGSALLTGSLSFGPIVRALALYRTRYIDNLGIGAAKTVNVPPFAKTLLFFSDTPVDTYNIGFNDVTGSNVYNLVIAANSTMLTPVVLSGDITNITVTNTGGGSASGCRLVFGLEL